MGIELFSGCGERAEGFAPDPRRVAKSVRKRFPQRFGRRFQRGRESVGAPVRRPQRRLVWENRPLAIQTS